MSVQLVSPFNSPLLNRNMLGAQIAQTTTIIPTDVVPLPGPHEGYSSGKAFQLRMLQRLPSKFYLNAINESSFRLETNPFQYPTRSALQQKITRGIPISAFAPDQQAVINTLLGQTSQTQTVFRELPNITAGWQLTPRTAVYSQYFLIRDSLFHSTILNSTIQSVGGGIQHNIPIGSKLNIQPNLQFRELFQSGQVNVFDYLPQLTASYQLRPATIAYASALLQLRGTQPFCAPTREIDPFYTVGVLTQKGRWLATASGTFLQNFRTPFGSNALAPINNYSFVCDLEIDRQIFKNHPGMQAFIRAEPIWNLHSKNAPGFSGFDFRLFYGVRMTVGKVALTEHIQKIKEQLEQQEVLPPVPGSEPVSFDPYGSSLPARLFRHRVRESYERNKIARRDSSKSREQKLAVPKPPDQVATAAQ